MLRLNGDAADTRPCGRLENWSVYRGNLGIYANVAVAMRYVPRETLDRSTFGARVTRALRDRVIPALPLLGCVLVDGDTARPRFKKTTRRAGGGGSEVPVVLVKDCGDIQGFLRREHDQYPTDDRLWRVSIVPANDIKGKEEGASFWVSFAFHHAIGDGTSGLIFHEHLLRALQDPGPTHDGDASLPLPPSIEDCGLDLRVPISELVKEVHRLLPLPASLRSWLSGPDYYGGLKTSSGARRRSKTGMVTMELGDRQVARLRMIAKEHGISVHALLHGASVHSIDTEAVIKTSTPISLRPLVPEAHRRQMANYVSAHLSTSSKEDDPISTAQKFHAELHGPESRRRALHLLGKLSYVNNYPPRGDRPCGMEQTLLDMRETSRDHCLGATLEISNLGNVSAVIDVKTTENIQMLTVVFLVDRARIGGLACRGRVLYEQ